MDNCCNYPAGSLAKFWPEQNTRSERYEEMLDLAAVWAKFNVPGVQELVFLGKRNLTVILDYTNEVSTVLRKTQRRLSETVERLEDTTAFRMQMRMKADRLCDFAGEELGKLTTEEIEQLSLKQLQSLQKKTAKRIRQGCRFGPIISNWCPKAPSCRELRRSKDLTACQYCGRCTETTERPICIFAEVSGSSALRKCIEALKEELLRFNTALEILQNYAKAIRSANRRASAKKPLLPIWREYDHFQVGSVAMIFVASAGKFQAARITGFEQAPRDSRRGLRSMAVAQDLAGNTYRIACDDAKLMDPIEYRFLQSHANFAGLWFETAPIGIMASEIGPILTALRSHQLP